MAIVYETLTGVMISMTVVTTVMKMAAVSLNYKMPAYCAEEISYTCTL